MSLQRLLACTMIELKNLQKNKAKDSLVFKRQPSFHRVSFMASTAKYAKKDALVHAVMRLFKKKVPIALRTQSKIK